MLFKFQLQSSYISTCEVSTIGAFISVIPFSKLMKSTKIIIRTSHYILLLFLPFSFSSLGKRSKFMHHCSQLQIHPVRIQDIPYLNKGNKYHVFSIRSSLFCLQVSAVWRWRRQHPWPSYSGSTDPSGEPSRPLCHRGAWPRPTPRPWPCSSWWCSSSTNSSWRSTNSSSSSNSSTSIRWGVKETFLSSKSGTLTTLVGSCLHRCWMGVTNQTSHSNKGVIN